MSGPRVFIGCSTEGKDVAENLQAALGAAAEVVIWDQGVFTPGHFTMEELEREAQASDFAVMVMTPDDTIQLREETKYIPRGNVLIELGLFMGALGIRRVLMLAPSAPPLDYPSDLAGITRLHAYEADRRDGNLLAALGPAALQLKRLFRELGARPVTQGTASSTRRDSELLQVELDLLATAADAQGWRRIRPNATTTFRLVSPRDKRYSFTIPTDAAVARAGLRPFVRELRSAGLRVSDRLRRPA